MNGTVITYLANVSARIVGLGLLFFAASRGANAGPAPLSMEARLDTAKYVFSGKVTHIEKTEERDVRLENQIRFGLATIAVKEVLKGNPSGEVKLDVPIAIPKGYRGAYMPRLVRVGDFGIWLVGHRDRAFLLGFYDQDVKTDMQRLLKLFQERKWSEPVRGLRAWAAACGPPLFSKATAAFVFAVNNVSDSDIFVPIPYIRNPDTASEPGILTATAKDHKDRVFDFWSDGRQTPRWPIRCETLRPGETTYLEHSFYPHPGEAYSAASKKLAAGRYQIVVTYKNDRDDGMVSADQPQKGPRKVTPWKGKLNAPPIELLLSTREPAILSPPVTND